MIKVITNIVFLLAGPLLLFSQDISGRWQGYVTMEGYQGKFLYQIDILEEEGSINGASVSMLADSSIQVHFQLAGTREGEEVLLQEIQQTSPPPPVWCLKYASLKLEGRNDSLILTGNWRGGNCNPGTVYLVKQQAVVRKKIIVMNLVCWQ